MAQPFIIWSQLPITLCCCTIIVVVMASSTAAATLDLYKNARTSQRIIATRYGLLQGVVLPLDNYKFLRPIEAYLGVPYATPPTLLNRFSPTRAPLPWDGIRLSDKFSPVCPQRLPNVANETAALEKMPKGRLEYLKRLLPFLENQSEDCLYLNVFVPVHAAVAEKKLPVIIFLHGESFDWGGGSPYDGTVLASYGEVVVVTINYRLGILGFLNANPIPHLRARVANYGLMDQIAALHWVKQNIAKFGGDHDSVTLAGQGTGAACINFLMTSPTMVPGLFHRAILLSGSAFSSWALVDEPVGYAVRLAREVNCSVPEDMVRNHELIVDCLRDVPLEDLYAADIQAPSYLSAFGPSVDGVVIRAGQQPEEEDEPTTRGQSKRSQEPSIRYDLLFGVVTGEALWRFSAADIQNGFEGERRDKILRTYVRNAYTYHLSEIFYTVVNEYTDWERTSQHPINTRDAAVSALSDAQFVAPLVHTGDVLAPLPALPGQEKAGIKCFFYVFDYQTKDGDYPQRMGTVHGEDLPYVFGAPLVDGFSHFPRNYTKSEVALSEALMVFWSNFARTGNPNEHHRQDPVLQASKERNRFRSIVWEEYDPVHQKYLEIGMKPRMKNHFRAHQLSIWLRLIPELHRAGMEDVIARHNMFKNHDNTELYDGPVKPDTLSRLTFLDGSSGVAVVRGNSSEYGVTTADPSPLTNCIPSSNYTIGHTNVHHNTNAAFSASSAANTTAADSMAGFEAAGYAAYSTALSVTIFIGCSLLILNVMIFAGVYYQRDKTRLEVKSLQKQYQQRMHAPPGTYDPIKHAHYHLGHSQSGSIIVDVEGQENGGGGTMMLSADTKPPHICANSMQISTGATNNCIPNKLPLGDAGGGGGGTGVTYSVKQQQHHSASLARNNSLYNSGMMTLPKKVGGVVGGGGGGGGMAQPNNYTRNDCMTLPRNLNASNRNALNGATEAPTSGISQPPELLTDHIIQPPSTTTTPPHNSHPHQIPTNLTATNSSPSLMRNHHQHQHHHHQCQSPHRHANVTCTTTTSPKSSKQPQHFQHQQQQQQQSTFQMSHQQQHSS